MSEFINCYIPTNLNHESIPIMAQLIYKDLSYKVVGLLYELYNNLGYGYQEKYYQRAFSLLLKENNIKFEKELCMPIEFKDRIIGRYFMDFLIEDKIAIEFKISDEFRKQYFQQVISYLRSKNLKLGLIVLFTNKGIKYKRVVN